jgi:hypothetical protein
MSINANYAGNVEASEHYVLTGSAAQAGGAAADATRILAGFSFANTTAGAVVCQLIHRQGGVDYPVWVKSVAASDTAIIDNIPVRLKSGDTLKAVGASVTLTLTFIAAYPYQGTA